MELPIFKSVFSKIPFPIGIWQIEDSKIINLYKNQNFISNFDKEYINLHDDHKNFIENKKRFDLINNKYIVIHEFISDDIFYELSLPTNNIEYILSSVSCKIRSPLTNILGLIPMLNINDNNTEIIKRSGLSIVNVANNIVDILNVYQNKIKLDITEVDLNVIIKKSLKPLKSLILENENKIIFKNNKKMIIKTDEKKLCQIIIMLVDNANKFTNNGIIEIKLNEKNNNKIIKIKDTGIGITEKKQKMINKLLNTKLEDLDDSDNSRVYGLGLLICKYLCKELNIEINYTSTEGIGTKFYLKI